MIESLDQLIKVKGVSVTLGTARLVYDDSTNDLVIYSKPFGKRNREYKRIDTSTFPKDALSDAIHFLLKASKE